MCMNRCNRSLRSCTNYRRRIRGDYRLRELRFMEQDFADSEEREFARELSPGSLCEIAPSKRRNDEAALRQSYHRSVDRLSLRSDLHFSGPTNEVPTFLRTTRAPSSFSRRLASRSQLLPRGAFETGPPLLLFSPPQAP